MEESAVREFIDWAKDEAVPLSVPDWRKTSPTELAPLDSLIRDKRIVLLGEPDHNIAERIDYRLVMIRYLVQHGFRWIACEQGFSDGMRIDRYLESGDEVWIDRSSDQGHRSPELVPGRDDDYDPHRGRWPDAWSALRRSEDRWFYRQLREMGTTLTQPEDRVHYIGFDSDFVPGGGYEEISALLSQAPLEAESLVELRESLRRKIGESLDEEVERLSEAIELTDSERPALVQHLGMWSGGLLTESIVGLRDSLALRLEIELQFSGDSPDPVRWYQKMAVREEAMARRVDWLIRSIGPDEKIVVCAHNTHVAKDQRALWLGRTGETDVPPARTLGHHLAQKYGDSVAGIWLLFDSGEHLPHPMDRRGELSIPSDTQRIGTRLRAVGRSFVLPLASTDARSNPLDARWDWWTGAATQSAIPRRGADAIFFAAQVHSPGGRGD